MEQSQSSMSKSRELWAETHSLLEQLIERVDDFFAVPDDLTLGNTRQGIRPQRQMVRSVSLINSRHLVTSSIRVSASPQDILRRILLQRHFWDPLVSEYKLDRKDDASAAQTYDCVDKGSDVLVMKTGQCSFRKNSASDRQLRVKRVWSSGELVYNLTESASTGQNFNQGYSDDQLLYRLDIRVELDKSTNKNGGNNYSLVTGHLFYYFPGNLLERDWLERNDQLSKSLLERMLEAIKNSFDINFNGHMNLNKSNNLSTTGNMQSNQATRRLARSSSFSGGQQTATNLTNGLNTPTNGTNSSTSAVIKCVRV
jgi:hypothetical protein